VVAAVLTVSTDAYTHEAHEQTGKKAYFDTGEAIDFEFRSVSLGFFPDAQIELDLYLNSEWIVGANATYRWSLDEEDCIDECLRVNRYTAFGERVWGGRWGHVGLRAGPFVGQYYEQIGAHQSSAERTRDGVQFGPFAGATATFTPFRWAGFTLMAGAYPGIVTGREAPYHCWCGPGIRDEWDQSDDTRPYTALHVTTTVTLTMRVGDLDGPDRDCTHCGPSPTPSEPREQKPDKTDPSDSEPKTKFLPESRN
jgi:hypothetical protein